MEINQILWGDDSAEKDPNLLQYFVTSQPYKRVAEKAKNIVIGRKGSGKSALRTMLVKVFEEQDNTYVVNLFPKYNSIRTILNDKDLANDFGKEIFFQHTWLRQILLDSLCKIGDSAKGKYAEDSLIFAREISLRLNRTSKDLVENIAEILKSIKLKAGSLGELGLAIERELRTVAELDALQHHMASLCNSGAKLVVMIDDLDLGWDNSETANNLLLGLLSAINTLSSLHTNIHPIIFLREDVYSILIGKTQHSDKYRNVERLRWEKDELIQMLRNRINFNLKQAGEEIFGDTFPNVFPSMIGTTYCDNWLIERTLSRPRELIQLARYYTESVEGQSPSDEKLKESEANYSAWKLDDLCSEYSNQYPGLGEVMSYWKTKYFRHKYHLKRNEIEEMIFNILTDVPLNQEWFNQIVKEGNYEKLLNILYEIGFIGDFVQGGEGGSKAFYSFNERHEPRFEEIQIHPCFRRAVNTVERIRASK
jgi:energy-coupling factor transporter ATP-binding protein EcfA2